MATASAEMTTKLATDFLAVGKILEDMQKFINSVDDSPNEAEVAKLQAAFDRIKGQVVSFAAGLKNKPPIFPDEAAYKDRRKDVTAFAASAAKIDKAIALEKEALSKEVTVKAVSGAKAELVGKDKGLAQALTMVARGEKGRAGPKEEGVKQYNHIHVGGNAQVNLLFQPASKLVLGVLGFHLEKGLDKGKIDKIKKVASRSGSTITLKINDDTVSEK
jgi:hypothetical protein